MQRRGQIGHGLVGGLACAAAQLGGVAVAAEATAPRNSSRSVLESAYIDEYSERRSLYQSAPVTHVVPSFKTVTFALAAQNVDTTVTDTRFAMGQAANAEQSLRISGYSVAPYLAVSLQRIGLGFGVEAGKRALDYKVYDRTNPTATVAFGKKQRSDIDYRAIGAYLYLLPYETRGNKAITASLVVGAKDYNVTHDVGNEVNSSQTAGSATSYRYNITEYQLGMLVEMKLLRKFSLIPWADYTYIDVHDPIGQADSAIGKSSTSGAQRELAYTLKGDSLVVWSARPRLDLGLDFVVRIGGFAVHLGEVFGVLLDKTNDERIEDKGFYLSFSFDMRGD